MKSKQRTSVLAHCLMAFVIFALISFPLGSAFADGPPPAMTPLLGQGTPENPYRIRECEQLAFVNQEPDASYRLSNSFSCLDKTVAPIENFTGDYFDGYNNTISGISIEDIDHELVGLFRYVEQGSQIRNLYLQNISVTAGGTGSNPSVGTLVAFNYGQIHNVSVSSASVRSSGIVGGLAGFNMGEISAVGLNAITIVPLSGGNSFFGGVVGQNQATLQDATVNMSWTNVTELVPGSICGGIVGRQADGSISRVLFSGTSIACSPNDYSGGIVGEMIGEATIDHALSRASIYIENGAGLTAGIIGSNFINADISTTAYDATRLLGKTCDDLGSTQCHQVTDWREFYGLSGQLLQDFNVAQMGSDQMAQGSVWYMPETPQAFIDNNYDAGDGYLPRINNSNLMQLVEPVIKNVTATNDTASFSWNLSGSTSTSNSIADSCGCNSNASQWDIYVGEVPTDSGEDEISVTYNLLHSIIVPSGALRSDTYTYTATDLNPNVYYDFIVRGHNSVGDGLESQSVEIQPVPQTLAAATEVEIFPGAATIQWQDRAFLLSSYRVEYKKSTDSQWNTRVATDFPNNYMTVSPLEPDTSYDFRVIGRNIRGTSQPSEILTLSTTSQESHTISTCEQLQNISNDPYGHYTLTQDIDCSNSGGFNNDKGFIPIGIDPNVQDDISTLSLEDISAFTGTLDGANHSITNLHINALGYFGGLFAYIDGGVVKNLNLASGSVVGSQSDVPEIDPGAAVAIAAGGLSALVGNATIDNVTSDLDLLSNDTDGILAHSGGLIGTSIPSGIGLSSAETNLSISNSHSTGNNAGLFSGGIIGSILPMDLFVVAQSFTGSLLPQDPDRLFGSRLNVAIQNSTSSGVIRCEYICAGFVGLNLGNLTMSNLDRTGNMGSFDIDVDSPNPDIAILQMIGSIAAGAVGVNLPLSLNENTSTLTMSGIDIQGNIDGAATAGLIGVAFPSINLARPEITTGLEILTTLDDTNTSFTSLVNTLFSMIGPNVLEKGFTVSASESKAVSTCTLLCTGAVIANFSYGEFNDVVINGTFEKHAADPESNGDTIAMISSFGPFESGFVGINMPLTTSGAGGSALEIKNSNLKSNLDGTVSSGLVLLSLPALSLDGDLLSSAVSSMFSVIQDDGETSEEVMALRTQFEQQYGQDYQNDEETMMLYREELIQLFVDHLSEIVGYMLSEPSNTDSLIVQNTSVEGNISCSVLCAGGTGLSLSKMVFDGFHQIGNIVNDNTDFLSGGNPVGACPAQISGGIVGTQLLFPLDVNGSVVSGKMTVKQSGDFPDIVLADAIDTFLDPEDTESLIPGTPLPMGFIGIGCALGGSLLQGTGGVIGSYFSPLELSGLADTLADYPENTTAQWALTILNTQHSGEITSNSPGATGGLVGVSFGESSIDSSTNTGKITNSTFAEMFRTPLASASTGGLVGHSVGAFSLGGDLGEVVVSIGKYFSNLNSATDPHIYSDPQFLQDILNLTTILDLTPTKLSITNSSSEALIISSNTAGGLVGTISNGANISKSYSTGTIFGVTTGGLVGAGLNAGSLFGVLDLFSTLDINNSYSRSNLVASDAQDTFTFAGGLVGFMAHLGEFRIRNSYSTGDISVRNNSTSSRLVAGGFVGAELDLSIPSKLLKAVVNSTAELSTGDQEIDSYYSMIKLYGQMGLNALNDIGLPLKSGFSVTNSFTTSFVPADTKTTDELLNEIGTGDPLAGITSGSMYGFAFTISEQELQDSVDGLISTLNDLEDTSEQDDVIPQLISAAMEVVGDIDWGTPDQMSPNSYYDASATQELNCSKSIIGVADLMLFEAPKILDATQGDTPVDYYSFIPPIDALGGTPCGSVNTDSVNENYFINNNTVAPLNVWNFSTVWNTHDDDYPTFVADTGDPDTHVDPPNFSDPPPGTGTQNPNTGGPGSFIPKKITLSNIASTFDRIKATAAAKPLSKVLPKFIGDNKMALEKDVKKLTEGEKQESFGAKIIGIMSATGMFLLRNIITVLLLITIGSLIWYSARKPKGGNPKTSKAFKDENMVGFHT